MNQSCVGKAKIVPGPLFAFEVEGIKWQFKIGVCHNREVHLILVNQVGRVIEIPANPAQAGEIGLQITRAGFIALVNEELGTMGKLVQPPNGEVDS